MPEHIGCCIIVQNAAGEVLLAERKGPAYGAGLFGVPGGRVEGSESLEACARRELAEEVGIVAYELEYLGVIREWQESNNFVHFFFVCREWQGNPKTKEPEKAGEWEWFALDALPAHILPGHQAGFALLSEQKSLVDLI